MLSRWVSLSLRHGIYSLRGINGVPGLFLLALVVGLTTASTVVAQSLPQELAIVSYDVGGRVHAGDGGGSTPWGGTDVRLRFGHASPTPVSLDKTWGTSESDDIHGDARAEITVTAQAEIASLRVGLTSGQFFANTKAVTGNPNDLHFANASMDTGKVQARWQDTMVAEAPGVYRRTIFIALLKVTGDLNLGLTKPDLPPGTYAVGAGSGGDLTVRLFSSADLVKPYPQGYVGRVKADTTSGPIVNDPPIGFIPVTMIMRDGEPFTIDYTLELLCTASAYLNTNAQSDVFTAAYVNADFSHTLQWGGITSATDFDTGLPVTDYSLISASGFDYRYPTPVPEPAAGAMLLCLISLCLATRRRACCKSQGER